MRPYRVLAAAAGIAEEDAIARIRRLQAGPVRQIGGVFDPCLLGYRSAALLMECAPSGAAEFAEASSRHPWVVRTSLCDPSGTVWLWLALPDNADLQWEAERLAGLQPVRSMVVMPIAAVYRAPVERRGAPPAQWREIEPHGQVESLPTEFERRAIRVLQRDLPLSEWAFDDLAARVGCGLTARGLVRVGREFMARGWLRRYGAVMRLPRRGEEVSAIGAWRVPDTGASSVAARIARVPGVVEAAVLEGCSCWWPYNIVAEVDGHNTAECGSILKAASAVAPDCPRTSVAEVQDLKRARPRFYFREPTAA
ncbi:MAG TPA: hypothetical protein VLH79_01290 [Chthonomonadales bacterium]|nr:hypothetical protein [Chthonomonadales bacterium]